MPISQSVIAKISWQLIGRTNEESASNFFECKSDRCLFMNIDPYNNISLIIAYTSGERRVSACVPKQNRVAEQIEIILAHAQ